MPRKLTKYEFISKCIEVHGNLYDYSKFNYINNSTKSIVICKEHGEFEISPNKHISAKNRCAKCSGKYSYSPKEYIEKVKEIHGNEYDYTDTVYKSSHENVIITCKVHGNFELKAYSHINGRGCSKCKGQKISNALRLSLDDRLIKFKEVHGKTYDYSMISFIKNNRSKIKIICSTHGVFEQSSLGHANGQGCPDCAIILSRKTHDNYIKDIVQEHGDKYDYSLVEYVKVNDKIKIICKEHGQFIQTAKNHLAGQNCPSCASNVFRSSQEIKIEKYLKSIGVKYEISNKTILYPQELDIYIPSKNIAIEVNGIYWHSDKFKDKNYHLNKTILCENNNINLVHFTDKDVDNKFDIITSMLGSKLDINNKIYARKCSIREVSTKESNNFLEISHLQGKANSSIQFGLYYENTLVSLMTFGKPRFNRNYEWELIRFASKLNTNVIGGASKLLKHFIINYSNSIISYANKMHSTGKLYTTIGFTKIRESAPGYSYHKKDLVYSRYQAQKHKLHKIIDNFDINLTEEQNMNNDGYHKVFDCGNNVYEYTII